MKRQRGRSRKNNNHNNSNRSMESNGPDVKVRGTATQIHDKYVALARDAAAGGNRVKAENLRQHAEHYLRMMNEIEAAKQAAREQAEAKQAETKQAEGQSEDGERENRGRRYPPRVGRNQDKKSDVDERSKSDLDAVAPEPKEEPSTPETISEPVAKSTTRRKAPSRKPAEESVAEAAE